MAQQSAIKYHFMDFAKAFILEADLTEFGNLFQNFTAW